MKIVFTTSRERNGTALLRDNLPIISAEWMSISSYTEMALNIFLRPKRIKAIFCLSDNHFIFVQAICRFLGLNIPVVLGYFHPEQWRASLDLTASKTRAKVVRRIIDTIPPDNIVFSSRGGALMASSLMEERCGLERLMLNIVPGPIVQSNLVERINVQRDAGALRILTIGRFVPFKNLTICAMIDVIDGLVSDGYDIRYSIYGGGPSVDELVNKVREAVNFENFEIGGFVSESSFEDVCFGHDVFFGMGGSLVRAAMLGMPSLVAIQRCEEQDCFGLFSRYDHSTLPIFGDEEPGLERHNLKNEVISLYNCIDLHVIGAKCKEASLAYSAPETMRKLNSIMESARFFGTQISLFEVLSIRLELFLCRVLRRMERDL